VVQWLKLRETTQACSPQIGANVASITQFSIVTYERKPGFWRAAITPIRPSGIVVRGQTVTSIVTPDDYSSEPDAEVAAHKIILKL
jgi:hypothetical protein